MKKYIKIIISIALPLLAGFLGSFFTSSSVDTWYTQIAKPVFNPPSWIFGPVWTILYILMGIAFYFVWTSDFSPRRKKAILLFFVGHLFLNLAWSLIFFGSPFLSIGGVNNIGIAFFEIVVLWLCIAILIFLFWRVRKIAGILLVPYILWVSFASVLNFEIWRLNPSTIVNSPIISDAWAKCEEDTGLRIGENISMEGRALFNATDGSWYVIERVPKDERHPYAYIHRAEGTGPMLKGGIIVRGVLTGFDPEERKVFFYNHSCLPDIEIEELMF